MTSAPARSCASTARRTASSPVAWNSASSSRPSRCSWIAWSIQRGRGQLPIPSTDSGRIDGAADGEGRSAGIVTAIGWRVTVASASALTRRAGFRSASFPLQTRKLRSLPRRTKETSSLPVSRHQAGKSSSTEISVERNSRSWPRSIGSMCCRIRRRSPLPQSRSPPSKLRSASSWWRSTGSIAEVLSVAHAGAAFGQELDELGAADDRGAGHQVVLVELALLEARRADVDRAAGLGEIVHQLTQRGEPLFADVVGVALLGEAHAFDAQEDQRLLAGADRGVGDHEADRGLVLVVLRVGEADTESVGHDSVLLSTDLVHGMLLGDQRVAGHAAPGRNVRPRARVARGELQELPRPQRFHAQAKLEHEIAAAEIPRIPLGIGGARGGRGRAHGSLRSPLRS